MVSALCAPHGTDWHNDASMIIADRMTLREHRSVSTKPGYQLAIKLEMLGPVNELKGITRKTFVRIDVVIEATVIYLLVGG